MIYVLTQRALKYTTIKAVRARQRLLGPRLAKPSVYCFAFGANLNLERFTKYAMNVEHVGVAKLPGYRFTFGLPCEYLGKGYGDITPDPQSEVWGLLFKIDPLSLFLLDIMEWKIMGQYRRIEVDVETREGMKVRACAYQARCPREGLVAPVGYQKAIVASAKRLGFPESYIAQIEAYPSREKFDLDPTFSFLHPHRPRFFARHLRRAYLAHDRVRERVCDWLRF
jgi:gamma-glutamylcyclotransferase (GGCT)/AIG2-like uncharacterized protein YtfP